MDFSGKKDLVVNLANAGYLWKKLLLVVWDLCIVPSAVDLLYMDQRPYRKDRFPRDFYCCRRGYCLYNTLVWLVCYNPTLQCFPDCGVWGTVDLIQNTRFYGGETWAHGLPIQEEEEILKQESAKLFQYLHPL